MKQTFPHLFRNAGVAILIAASALSARAAVSMQLDRTDIGADESAELTVTASGNGSNSVTPPSVPGLQITPVSQSSQIQIINGSVSSTSSITYQVTPQGPGTYSIPSSDPNAPKLTLHVSAGSGAANPPQVATIPPASAGSPLPNVPLQGPTPNAPHMVANGAAFMRVQMPHHDLYVGETIPIDIQIGLRSGMAASLNGLPTASADAFTLNKLSTKPEETEEMIDGQPYTILTWHSVLAAVKPGDFSLSMQSPVTVQVRTRARRMPGMDDMFNDPFFQNFFGGNVTQKDIVLASEPAAIKVLPLPTTGQPSDFTGAVGSFTVSSELSATSGTVGDPLTLRLKVNGEGAFDRVESSMLSSNGDWKTYRSTGKFVPADSVGYSGEKDFEQAIIPLKAGHQTVPPITFSFFNPETHEYQTLHTQPTPVEVAAGTLAANTAATPAPQADASATPPTPPVTGLRPDMAETGIAIRTLQPLYFQPGFLVAQSALVLAFVAAGFWLRRNDRLAADPTHAKRRQELKAVDAFLAKMDSAAQQRDAATFFSTARQALQHCLASKWKMAPAAITLAEVESRLSNNENVRRVFAFADELAYSGGADIDADFPAWKQTVHQIIKETL